MSPLFAILLLVALVVILGIIFYNRIVALKFQVDEGWSDIQVQLKRRHDLIGNLIETVKGYAKHEAETLEKVVSARNAAKENEGKDMKTVAQSEQMLTSAMQGLKINALSEAYPDLKANTSFNQLQAELSDTENKIAASRRFFNSTVLALNTSIQQFPTSLFAGMAGAVAREFFELDEEEAKKAEKAPEVKF
jgi:LemA protein